MIYHELNGETTWCGLNHAQVVARGDSWANRAHQGNCPDCIAEETK